MSAAVDLHLKVRTEQDRHGRSILAYELRSPSSKLALHTLEARSEPFGTGAAPRHELLSEDLRRLLRGVYTDSQTWTRQRISEQLRVVGQNLYLRLFPAELRQIFDRPTTPGAISLIVESDETEIPWEIVHTQAPDGDFFCLRFAMARWLPQRSAPRTAFAIGKILAVEAGEITDPEIAGRSPRALPRAKEELRLLEELAEQYEQIRLDPLPDAERSVVLGRLETGDFDLLHFIGHAHANGDSIDRAALHLNGGWLEAQSLVGVIVPALARRRPFVFLNSCLAGAQGQALTGIGGWPQRFVQICRCGGFLGPQWPVKTQGAFHFARAFYQNLESGLTLGEAVRRARQARSAGLSPAEDTGPDPHLLAYSLYGNPNAVVRWDGPAPEGEAMDEEPVAENEATPVSEREPPEIARGLGTPVDFEQEPDMARKDRYDPPPQAPESNRGTRVSGSSVDFGGFENISGGVRIEGGIGNTHVDQSTTVHHTTEAVGPEERLQREARYYFELGQNELSRGDFAAASDYLRQAGERAYVEGIAYALALARIAGRRPRTIPLSQVREIEDLLLRSLRKGEGSQTALLLAFLKHDYHRMKGLVIKPPTIEELLGLVRHRPPTPSQVAELERLVPGGEYFRQVIASAF